MPPTARRRDGVAALGEAEAGETVDPWITQIARASSSTAAITHKVTVFLPHKPATHGLGDHQLSSVKTFGGTVVFQRSAHHTWSTRLPRSRVARPSHADSSRIPQRLKSLPSCLAH
jgi:hypothetical protein